MCSYMKFFVLGVRVRVSNFQSTKFSKNIFLLLYYLSNNQKTVIFRIFGVRNAISM